MTEMELLKSKLEAMLPGLTLVLDPPEQPGGRWWLDVELHGHSAVVDWKPNQGFGVCSTPTDGFGEGPDEVYRDARTAAARLVELLRTKGRTKPPQEVLLSRLRQGRRVSQAQLARTLRVGQAAISKMERRSDMYISTLRNAISALGGTIEIRARFPEGVVGISQFQELRDAEVPAPRRRSSAAASGPQARRAVSRARASQVMSEGRRSRGGAVRKRLGRRVP